MSVLAQVGSEPIPGYALKKRIGAGGYGEVWQADAPGDLAKAIKFVYGFLDEDRAARELKALSRIRTVRHPFLLSLERIEVVQGQLVIVTELADGSLKDEFEKCKRLGAVGIARETLLVYMSDAADALDYMSDHHALQHLDVKPENLLLVGGRIKVADFGLVKDLREISVSMLGGLTPLYAPPELFDSQPSRRSDQYSLAIVYQEMLTGVLPFPGATAAQLAAQHLNSRPRLGSLPVNDQAVVAQALSKDPEQRFSTCRAFIEALAMAGKAATPAVGTAPNPEGPSYVNARTTSPDGLLALGAKNGAASVFGTESFDAACSPSGGGVGSASAPGAAPVRDSRPRASAPVLTPLPPPQIADGDKRPRPTLFVGIGGLGAAVLSRLYRRFRDHLGSEAALAAFPLLLFDTDSRALQETAATTGASARALRTLPLPLRRPQDYHNDSRALTRSTSRRWLYNIPRSLQTDGLRPLGRLALADHIEEVGKTIGGALREMLAPDSLAASQVGSGLECLAAAPRVVIVSSISGGAGSGMVLETAYAVRKELHALGWPQDLTGLLAHATPRDQAGRDLSVSNAVSCLGELRQFMSSGNGYPGDTACGLPAFSPDTPTFDELFLIHLGEQLANDEFEKGANQIAEFAFLSTFSDLASRVGRRPSRAASRPSSVGGTLRTLGLHRLGGVPDAFAALATDALCRQVSEEWLGPSPEVADDRARWAADSTSIAECEELATAQIALLHLDFDRLVSTVQQFVGQESAANSSSRIHSARLNHEKAIASRGAQYAEERAAALVAWLMPMVNEPQVRVRRALGVGQAIVARLRGIDEQARAALARLEQEHAELELVLAALNLPDKSRQKGKATLTPEEIERKRQHVEQMKLLTLILRGVRQTVQLICGRAVLATEKLRDLSRDVQFFSTQFQMLESWDDSSCTPESSQDLAHEIGVNARRSLERQFLMLVRELNASFQAGYLVPQGGLWSAFDKADHQTALAKALRERGREVVALALRAVDMNGAIFPAGKSLDWTVSQFKACLERARPKLTAPNVVNRLLVVMPGRAESGRIREFLENRLGESPEFVAGDESDLVFFYESEDRDIQSVVVDLAGDRTDYVEAASRLHIRSDIAWMPILST